MASKDMQGFKHYVKQGREGAGMLFPGIRIRVDQDEGSEVKRRGNRASAMRLSKGLKKKCLNSSERKIKRRGEGGEEKQRGKDQMQK